MPGNQAEMNDDGTATRAHPRLPVKCRSAIWLDEGPEQGLLGTVSDLSMGGFSVRLLTLPPDTFKPGAMLFCVLLLQGAHFDCMAQVRSVEVLDSGNTHVGFSIDALSDQSSILLSGILRFLQS